VPASGTFICVVVALAAGVATSNTGSSAVLSRSGPAFDDGGGGLGRELIEVPFPYVVMRSKV
jgi:hypothetical protein